MIVLQLAFPWIGESTLIRCNNTLILLKTDLMTVTNLSAV